MRSHIWPLFCLTIVLGVFGGFSWLTRNPDAELVRRAERWPLIGPYAEGFRQAYTQPPAGETFWQPSTVIERLPELPRHVWVEAGQALHRDPHAGSPVVQKIETVASLAQLEQQGDWYKVWSNRYQAGGWVHLPGYYERAPPMGMKPDPPGPLYPKPADPELLRQALELFEGRQQTHKLGPYTLYTDIDDHGLIRSLERLAVQMDRVYTDRYGLEPRGTPVESVVLYAQEGAYRIVQQRSDHLHGLDATGHASRGMVVFFTGNRSRPDIRSTFVHELGHLLTRRAVGPALTPWLDEGLADDLANGTWHTDGRLKPAELGGTRLNWGDHLTYGGGWAALLNLQQAVEDGRMPELEHLLSFDWQDFVGHDSRLHYDASAFFVRFLLADEAAPAPTRAAAFRDFLATVAGGEKLTPELLRERLDLPWPTLDAAYRGWIVAQARTLRSTAP